MMTGRYRPQPSRRVYIPKQGRRSEERPLSMPGCGNRELGLDRSRTSSTRGIGHQSKISSAGDVLVALELDAKLTQSGGKRGVSQRCDFDGAFGPVDRSEVGREQAWVTRDLVPTRPELFTQQAAEETHANLVEVPHTPLPLGIEASNDVDPPVTTERHPQRFDHLLEQRQQSRSPVSMTMRVDVRGQPAHQ